MSNARQTKLNALRAAFPHTIPVMAGYLFLGTAYGIYMKTSGFPWFYPMLTSLSIFAGAMEFVTVNVLLGGFNPLSALMLTLMVNARHLFYGIAMLERYRDVGRKKLYMIFGLTDETFSVNLTAEPPEGVDRGWFMFFVTLLDHSYWVTGCTAGGIFGSLIRFDVKGLDFVMTALLLVIFLNNWLCERSHWSSLIGLGVTAAARLAFSSSTFIIPAMLGIIALLTLLRRPLTRVYDKEGTVRQP